jgi:hypothetical protein
MPGDQRDRKRRGRLLKRTQTKRDLSQAPKTCRTAELIIDTEAKKGTTIDVKSKEDRARFLKASVHNW